MQSEDDSRQGCLGTLRDGAQLIASSLKWYRLRFGKNEDEQGFKVSVQESLGPPLLIGSAFASITILAALLSALRTAPPYHDKPFAWVTGDPRTLFFASHLAAILLGAVVAALALWRNCLKCCTRFLDLEWIGVAYGVCLLGLLWPQSAWYSARMMGVSPEEVWDSKMDQSEVTTLVQKGLVLIGTAVFLPIRACVMWVIPFSAVLIYLLVVNLVGSADPTVMPWNVLRLCLTALLCFIASCRNECYMRERWMLQHRLMEREADVRESSALAGAYQLVTGALCDVVMQLSHDLTFQAADSSLELYFGRALEGVQLLEFLNQEDQQRLIALLHEAAESEGALFSIVVAIENNTGIVEAAISLVDTGLHAPKYIVGVSSQEAPGNSLQRGKISAEDFTLDTAGGLSPIQEGEECDFSMTPERLEAEQVMLTASRGMGKLGLRGVFDDLAILEARMEATDAASAKDFFRSLAQVVEVGSRESWLLGSNEVLIDSSKILGSGSRSVVLGGELNGTEVAVKVARSSDYAVSVLRLPAIAQELRMLQRVRHPALVQFYGAILDPERSELALVFEAVKGLRLDAYLGPPPIGPGAQGRWQLLFGLSQALRFLHSLTPTMVHGELKASSIMVERHIDGPVPKLVDFGQSRVIPRASKTSSGSIPWMAPEVLSNSHGVLATSADVFSFGRIAYFVVTGRKPLHGVPKSLVKRMLKQKRPIALTWPPNIELATECAKLCEDCHRCISSSRPDMIAVQEHLLKWPIACPAPRSTELQALGDIVDLQTILLQAQAVGENSPARPSISDMLPQDAGDCDLIVPSFKATSASAKEVMLVEVIMQWNIPLPSGSCCRWHAAAQDLSVISTALCQHNCKPFQPAADWQCPTCGILKFTDDEDARPVCEVCAVQEYILKSKPKDRRQAALDAKESGKQRDKDASGTTTPRRGGMRSVTDGTQTPTRGGRGRPSLDSDEEDQPTSPGRGRSPVGDVPSPTRGGPGGGRSPSPPRGGSKSVAMTYEDDSPEESPRKYSKVPEVSPRSKEGPVRL